jgi:hypothetical protein
VNDAERLRHDPAMRWIVGGKAAHGSAASPSQMGRFETQWLAAEIWVMKPISYARHRFPPDIIRHAVWLYIRFTVSYRDVEDLLAERGLTVAQILAYNCSELT